MRSIGCAAVHIDTKVTDSASQRRMSPIMALRTVCEPDVAEPRVVVE